ncbi:MAG: hypothetical protein ACT4QF_23575 [Sporichthyaceae bacterium]
MTTAALLAFTAIVFPLAAAAEACSCSNQSPTSVDLDIATGNALAVVTRTDPGGAVANFVVEKSLGGPLPPRLDGRVDLTRGGCQPFVPPAGGVGALVFTRDGEGWRLGRCSQVDLAYTLYRVQGPPTPVVGGDPVAVAAGRFGGSRLVALDAEGNPVAWDGRPGSALVAACPGGRRVASIGTVKSPDGRTQLAEVTVHDAATLTALRTVPLQADRLQYVEAVRCLDAEGERVVAIAFNEDGVQSEARFLTVQGLGVQDAELAPIREVAAVPGGFVGVGRSFGALAPLALVRVADDGRVRTLAADTGFGYLESLAVTPDGRYAALYGSPVGRARTKLELHVFDLRTGRIVAEHVPTHYVQALAWTASRQLLMAVSKGPRVAAPPVEVRDLRLRLVGTRPSAAGYRLAAMGETAVRFNGGRVHLAPAAGTPTTLNLLRLVLAERLVPVGTGTFGG